MPQSCICTLWKTRSCVKPCGQSITSCVKVIPPIPNRKTFCCARHLVKTKYFQTHTLLTYPYNKLPYLGVINRPVKEVCWNSVTFITEAPPAPQEQRVHMASSLGKAGCDLFAPAEVKHPAPELQGSDLQTFHRRLCIIKYRSDGGITQMLYSSKTIKQV